MSLAIPTLEINGQPAISVRNGSYTVYELEPGKHTFTLEKNGNWNVNKIEFVANINQGERQFYRLNSETSDFSFLYPATTTTYVVQVTEKSAISEMQWLLHTANWP